MKTRILSLLMALSIFVTVGGVYANWTYLKSTDVYDESINMSLNLTGLANSDGYGAYEIDQSGLYFKIDPKENTSHTTALYITGELKVKFTPNTFAPTDIKENAVPSTYTFGLSNSNWKYEDKAIIAINHEEAHAITWTEQDDGTFTFTLSGEELTDHFTLTEFVLDTVTDYNAYNTVLGQGAIVFTVSDGQTSST